MFATDAAPRGRLVTYTYSLKGPLGVGKHFARSVFEVGEILASACKHKPDAQARDSVGVADCAPSLARRACDYQLAKQIGRDFGRQD